MVIQRLSPDLIPQLAEAFASWPKSITTFEEYLQEQLNNEREVWVALKDNQILGYVTLKWHSAYRPFQEKNIPEINDLNVLLAYRNQGVGSQLLNVAEKAAEQKSEWVGLGVGLYADYGSAQRLYVKRGYIPDGRGVTYDHEPVAPGASVMLDDDLILWMAKKLNVI
jgi:GNAT superfamily N-acetyltransferase